MKPRASVLMRPGWRSPRLFAAGAACLLLAGLGADDDESSWASMIIFALSYNMLLGQTGLLSFGHAVYFGLGGFVAIHAMNAVIHAKLGVPVADHSAGRRPGRARLRLPVRPRFDQARRDRLLDDLARHRRTRVVELVHPAHVLRRRGGDHDQSRQAGAALRATSSARRSRSII